MSMQAPKTMKFDAPKPKISTKSVFTGLSVVAKQKRIEKPTFKMAVWVSRLLPGTTNDDMANYIVSNKIIAERSKFNVHKLIKKDQDESTLKFVSFKVHTADTYVYDISLLWRQPY